MFASRNLIVEFGLMILILLGWEFLAELLGGLVLIAVAVIVHVTLPENLFEQVRDELTHRDEDAGITEDPTCGMEAGTSSRSHRLRRDAEVLLGGLPRNLPTGGIE